MNVFFSHISTHLKLYDKQMPFKQKEVIIVHSGYLWLRYIAEQSWIKPDHYIKILVPLAKITLKNNYFRIKL